MSDDTLVLIIAVVIFLIGFFFGGRNLSKLKNKLDEMETIILALKKMFEEIGVPPEEKHIQNYYAYEIKESDTQKQIEKDKKWKMIITLVVSAMFLVVVFSLVLLIIIFRKYGFLLPSAPRTEGSMRLCVNLYLFPLPSAPLVHGEGKFNPVGSQGYPVASDGQIPAVDGKKEVGIPVGLEGVVNPHLAGVAVRYDFEGDWPPEVFPGQKGKVLVQGDALHQLHPRIAKAPVNLGGKPLGDAPGGGGVVVVKPQQVGVASSP